MQEKTQQSFAAMLEVQAKADREAEEKRRESEDRFFERLMQMQMNMFASFRSENASPRPLVSSQSEHVPSPQFVHFIPQASSSQPASVTSPSSFIPQPSTSQPASSHQYLQPSTSQPQQSPFSGQSFGSPSSSWQQDYCSYLNLINDDGDDDYTQI